MLTFGTGILLYLFVAVFLGFLLGYLLWGRHSRRRQIELDELNGTLTEERQNFAAALSEHRALVAGKDRSLAIALASKDEALDRRDAEILSLRARLEDLQPLEARVCELSMIVGNRDQELTACHAASLALQKSVAELTQFNGDLEAQLVRQASLLAEKVSHHAALQAHLDDAESHAGELRGTIAELKPLVEQLPTLRAAYQETKSELAAIRALEAEHSDRTSMLEDGLATKEEELEHRIRMTAQSDAAGDLELAKLRGELDEALATTAVPTPADVEPPKVANPMPASFLVAAILKDLCLVAAGAMLLQWSTNIRGKRRQQRMSGAV